MKVKVRWKWAKEREIELVEYFEISLDGDDYERGDNYSAQVTATNGNKALGRLCEFLVSKNIMSLSEIVYIVYGYDAEQLEKVEEDGK